LSRYSKGYEEKEKIPNIIDLSIHHSHNSKEFCPTKNADMQGRTWVTAVGLKDMLKAIQICEVEARRELKVLQM